MMLLTVVLVLSCAAVSCADIVFPGGPVGGGRRCRTSDGRLGSCKDFSACSVPPEDVIKILISDCRLIKKVCCPSTSDGTTTTAAPYTDYFEKFAKSCGRVSRVGFPTIGPTLPNLELQKELSTLTRVKRSELPPEAFKKPDHHIQVVGGTDVERNAYPWMALLWDGTSWFCGGALISDRHVITAAHCFGRISKPDFVRLGEHDVSKTYESPHKDIGVSRVVKHPAYRSPQLSNDIAIVILSSAVSFSQYIRPVCMPTGLVTPNSDEVTGTITGWGTTSFGGVVSNILQEVDVPIVDKTACEASYKTLVSFRRLYPQGFPQQLFCAAEEGGNKDACQGDSGGPFMVKKNGKYTIEGIVSAGQGCGSEHFPGLYTWVYPYMNWIRSNVT